MIENIGSGVSYESLVSYSKETCELCDKVFNNRYESIVHNVTHIIIPLQKLGSHCNKCGDFFSTRQQLDQHVLTDHPLVIKSERLNFWDVQQNLSDNVNVSSFINGGDRAAMGKSICQKENHMNNKANGTPSEAHKTVTTEIIQAECSKSGINDNVKASANQLSIRDSLKFESDETIFMNVNYFVRTHLDNDMNDENSDIDNDNDNSDLDNDSDERVSVERVTEIEDADYKSILTVSLNNLSNEKSSSETIPYEELMTVMKFECRHCKKVFPSRFWLVVHEKSHIKFVRNIFGLLCIYCDKYIAGNFQALTNHIDLNHANKKHIIHCTGSCKRCGLNYRSYKQHIRNYHLHDCCNMKFDEFDKHIEKCPVYIHKAQICKPCYKALGNNNKFKLVKTGTRYKKYSVPCRRCKKNKMLRKLKVITKPQHSRFKVVSNAKRLKNIQARLKKLKIMSKCYCVVLILFHRILPKLYRPRGVKTSACTCVTTYVCAP